MLLLCLLIKLLLPTLSTNVELSETENKYVRQSCKRNQDHVSFIDAYGDQKQKPKIKLPVCPKSTTSAFATDCAEIFRTGFLHSGVAKVWPRNRAIKEIPFNVYCDMETDGGGWTVIQRRGNFSRQKDYFFRKWKEYKVGFGNIEKDFWLGNDKIFALTNQKLYSVRFDLKDAEGQTRFALYDTFWIDGEEKNYKLHIKNYSGDAGDSMIDMHDGQKFSTKDKDNDNSEKNVCAETYKGAWWYNNCLDSNLNGLYFLGKHQTSSEGINWVTWKGFYESLTETEIKIRPSNFLSAIHTPHL